MIPIRHTQIPQRFILDTDNKGDEVLIGINDSLQITQELRKTGYCITTLGTPRTVTGDFSILSNTRGNLFLTGLLFDYMCDAANTGTIQKFYYYEYSGAQSSALINFCKIASVAMQKTIFVPFEKPILIKQGGSIRGDFSFAAGAQSAMYAFYGYYE